MKYGIKTFGQVPNPNEVPEAWPALTVSYQDDDAKIEQQLISEGFTMQTATVYNAYVAAHQAEYDAWAEVHLRLPLIQEIRDRIDAQTDIIIANGYIYPPPPATESGQFKMDLEHQSTYKGSYDFREYIDFPYTIKGVGQFFLTFHNGTEMRNFVLYGFGWMQTVIQTGWGLKTALDSMTYEQLKNWTDPRI